MRLIVGQRGAGFDEQDHRIRVRQQHRGAGAHAVRALVGGRYQQRLAGTRQRGGNHVGATEPVQLTALHAVPERTIRFDVRRDVAGAGQGHVVLWLHAQFGQHFRGHRIRCAIRVVRATLVVEVVIHVDGAVDHADDHARLAAGANTRETARLCGAQMFDQTGVLHLGRGKRDDLDLVITGANIDLEDLRVGAGGGSTHHIAIGIDQIDVQVVGAVSPADGDTAVNAAGTVHRQGVDLTLNGAGHTDWRSGRG